MPSVRPKAGFDLEFANIEWARVASANRATWAEGCKLAAGSFMAMWPFEPSPSTQKSIGPSTASRLQICRHYASPSAGWLLNPT